MEIAIGCYGNCSKTDILSRMRQASRQALGAGVEAGLEAGLEAMERAAKERLG